MDQALAKQCSWSLILYMIFVRWSVRLHTIQTHFTTPQTGPGGSLSLLDYSSVLTFKYFNICTYSKLHFQDLQPDWFQSSPLLHRKENFLEVLPSCLMHQEFQDNRSPENSYLQFHTYNTSMARITVTKYNFRVDINEVQGMIFLCFCEQVPLNHG